MTRYYKVAGHVFCFSGEAEVFALMGNYTPFAVQGADALFSLNVESGEVPLFKEELRQEDEGQDIIGHYLW